MILSARFAGKFSSGIRKRGQDYYVQRRVRIQRGSDLVVTASVRGSRSYYVNLDWRGDRLSVSCDCPYFMDNEVPCKHLWATILAAQAQGLLAEAAAAANPMMECDLDDGDWELDDASPESPHLAPAHKPQSLRCRRHHRRLGGGRSARLFNTSQFVVPTDAWPAQREILYVVDAPSSLSRAGLILNLQSRDRKADGSWKPERNLSLRREQVAHLPLQEDREILSALAGANQYFAYSYGSSYDRVPESFLIPPDLGGMIMPRVTRTGRCYLRLNREADGLLPLAWDDGPPWTFRLEMRRRPQRGWVVNGVLCRADERMDLDVPALLTHGGFVITRDRVAPLAEGTPFEWVVNFRKAGRIEAPETDTDELLTALLGSPALSLLDLPEELRYEEVVPPPRPCLRIGKAEVRYANQRLVADLSFDYDGRTVSALDPVQGFYQAANRRLVRRDSEAEKAAAALLDDLGVKFRASNYWNREPGREVAPSKLPRVVRALVEAGWHIEAEGKIFRRPGALRVEVSSGVDWFELHGEVDYGDSTARLPALLEALRRGENMVRLDDGTYGLLPEEWLRRFGPRGRPGNSRGRPHPLPPQPGGAARCAAGRPARSQLRRDLRPRARGVAAVSRGGALPSSRQVSWASLRDYQREGLGWMEFLRRFSFGGCLADDMGVGKTAQVLALLETRRAKRAAGETAGPVAGGGAQVAGLQLEAGGGALHAPAARARPHRPGARPQRLRRIRRGAHHLRHAAPRRRAPQGHRVRLRRARRSPGHQEREHRIGQGRPPAARESPSGAERHARGEPPGRAVVPVRVSQSRHAGRRQRLQTGRRGHAQSRRRDPPAAGARAAAVHPAPHQGAGGPRTAAQERADHSLRDGTRPAQALQRTAPALPQLSAAEDRNATAWRSPRSRCWKRCCACARRPAIPACSIRSAPAIPAPSSTCCWHDCARCSTKATRRWCSRSSPACWRSCATVWTTSGITYEYLDGATRDRQARVERFQSDPDCRLFLISLKAGGLGLNLTAAEYVFLLDPWWNPAVEAQAVDRAHRIGQTRQVFAYRLIARDTVEEKVLELQKTKRDLADAIIGADNSLIRDLRPRRPRTPALVARQ